MDGVIFDSERLYIQCCLEAAEPLGLQNVVEVCRRCIGVTVDVTMSILLDAYGDPALVEAYRGRSTALFQEKYRAGLLPMKPGVKELLEYLKTARVKTAVASSTRTSVVESELAQYGLIDFFDAVVGGDRVKRSKPNPDIFLCAAARLDEPAENCTVIEDSYNGIRAAKAAGMTAVMVPDLLPPDDEMHRLADAIVPSLLSVPALFLA